MENQRVRTFVRRHGFSMASLVLTASLWMADNIVMSNIGRQFGFASRYSSVANLIAALLFLGMTGSAVLAMAAVARERPRWPGVLALAVAGFILFAWAHTA